MPETVVITGASAGVGRATAHAFAALGAQIGLIARGSRALQAAAAEVEKGGGKALALPLDPGTHGRFDILAEKSSLQLWAAEHRGALLTGALATAAFVTTLLVGARPLARPRLASGEADCQYQVEP